MSYPAKLLNPGEEVALDLRPHWKFLFGPVLAVVLTSAGSLVALADAVPRWAQLVLAGLLVVCLAWLALRWLRWTTTNFVLTSQRLVVRRGVLGRSGHEILLDRLTDTSFRQSLLDRLMRCGDVLVESPGRDSPAVFPDLPRPAAVQNLISRLVSERHQVAGAYKGSGTLVGGEQASVVEQLAELDRLRKRRLISRREFAAKRSELLSRM